MLLKSLYDGIVAAKNLAKEEEEAAVREALAELREKRKAAGAEQSADTETETEQVRAEAIQEEETKKIACEEMISLVNETEISAIDTRITTNSYKEVATMSTGGRVVTANDQRQWKERYGVRQRSQKRKQLHGGKWNR